LRRKVASKQIPPKPITPIRDIPKTGVLRPPERPYIGASTPCGLFRREGSKVSALGPALPDTNEHAGLAKLVARPMRIVRAFFSALHRIDRGGKSYRCGRHKWDKHVITRQLLRVRRHSVLVTAARATSRRRRTRPEARSPLAHEPRLRRG